MKLGQFLTDKLPHPPQPLTTQRMSIALAGKRLPLGLKLATQLLQRRTLALNFVTVALSLGGGRLPELLGFAAE